MTDKQDPEIYNDIAKTLIAGQVIAAVDKMGLFAEFEKEQHRRKLEEGMQASYQLRKLKMRR